MKKSVIILVAAFCGSFSFAQNIEVTFNKAENRFAAGKYKEASALYTEVISVDPGNMNAYLRRGFCRSALQQYDEAVKDYSHVIEKHPKHPFAYLSRGSAYNKKEEFKTAIIDFDRVLNMEPKNQEAYNNRGWAKNGLGLYKEACKDWKTSRKLGNEEAKIILKNNHCK
jgi:tetratricopeptide (TPR) repeat protein